MMDNRAENYDDSCFSENHEKIAALNDNLRKTFSGGNVMTSSGIVALGPKRKWEIIKQVKEFNEFDFRNDPYGEHGFYPVKPFRIKCKSYPWQQLNSGNF